MSYMPAVSHYTNVARLWFHYKKRKRFTEHKNKRQQKTE